MYRVEIDPFGKSNENDLPNIFIVDETGTHVVMITKHIWNHMNQQRQALAERLCKLMNDSQFTTGW